MKTNPFKLTSLGIQHVLAMYAGAVIVPLIVGGALGLTGEQLTYLVSMMRKSMFEMGGRNCRPKRK